MDASSTTTQGPAADHTRTRRRRWLIAGGLVLVALLALLVVWRLVGGGDLQRLSRAPDATVAAGTARVAVVATVEGVPVVGPFTFTVAEGEAELDAQRVRLRRGVPGVPGVPLLNRLLSQPLEILHDGRDTYLRLPIDGAQAWVRLGETDGPAAAPELTAPSLTNPVAAILLLRALDGMPEPLGEELVRGQPSTRFRVVVDLEQAADALSGRAEDVARALRRLRGRDDLPLEVWLDRHDRVTRLRYALEPDLGGRSGVVVIADLELFDFGLAVDIQAPAPDELVSLPTERIRELDPFARLREFLDR